MAQGDLLPHFAALGHVDGLQLQRKRVVAAVAGRQQVDDAWIAVGDRSQQFRHDRQRADLVGALLAAGLRRQRGKTTQRLERVAVEDAGAMQGQHTVADALAGAGEYFPGVAFRFAQPGRSQHGTVICRELGKLVCGRIIAAGVAKQALGHVQLELGAGRAAVGGLRVCRMAIGCTAQAGGVAVAGCELLQHCTACAHVQRQQLAYQYIEGLGRLAARFPGLGPEWLTLRIGQAHQVADVGENLGFVLALAGAAADQVIDGLADRARGAGGSHLRGGRRGQDLCDQAFQRHLV
jgi:hypothetical protein